MANNLKDLIVECVSLVDRAAVRDHANPTEPQRLLLWKAENDRSTMADAQQAMSDAISALQPQSDDPQIAALITKIAAIRAGDGEDRIAKAMLVTEQLRKSEDVPAETRARADHAHRALELEYLHSVNPRAAAAYERARNPAAA
jgi:uncharacterized protein (UPF0147 family)